MTDWVRASNPTAPINNEAEALAAARASAIAIFIGVLWGIVGIIYMMTAGQGAMEAALAQSAAEAPEVAGMAGIMTQAALWMAGILVVIQLVLGLVQWSKPNKVIPIIFIVLVIYGLGSTALGLMMSGQMDIPEAAQAPMWLTALGFVVMIVELVMHFAGVRGASRLDKLHMDAAQHF